MTAQAIGGGTAQAVIAAPDSGPLDLTGCGPVILNAGQTGYYRVRYSPEGMAALTDRFASLTADDQLGLLNDTQALAYVGDQPMAAWLNLTRRLDVEADPIVWGRLAGDLVDLDRLYDGLPGQAVFRAYARGVLTPALARVGWDARAGESDNTSLVRAAILGALGELGDPAVVAEAHHRFDGFVRDPDSLPPATRRTVLGIVAQHADDADWSHLHDLARSVKSELERYELYALLGQADDPALAHRALDLALSGEPPVTTTPAMIRSVARRHPTMALDFAAANWARISPLMEPDSQATFAPDLVFGGADPILADKLNAFADQHIPPNARRDVLKALASIRYRASVRESRLPEVDRWLAAAPVGRDALVGQP